MKFITRAFIETKSQLFALIFSALVGAISLYFLYIWKGGAAAIEEAPSYVAAIVGAIGGVILVLVWNLLCAPYRFQKERADAAEARINELEAVAINNGCSEIPRFLKGILSFRQCRVFAAGEKRIQVHYPWRLRCPPSVCIFNQHDFSMKNPEDYAISDITDLGFTITLTSTLLDKHSIDQTVRTFKQILSSINAASEENLTKAALVYHFPSPEDRKTHDQVVEFIVKNLNDPDKGLPFLIKLAKEQ